MTLNFSYSLWPLFRRAGMAGGLMGVGALLGVAYADSYYTPVVRLPLYGAGAAPVAAPAAAEPERQPEWAKEINAKLDRILKLLDELDDAKPKDDPPPAAASVAPLYFRQLNKAEEASVVRMVSKGKMPPPEAEPLTPTERAFVIAAYSGKEFDRDALSAVGAKCAGCHGPDTARKKGDGFVIFSSEAKK